MTFAAVGQSTERITTKQQQTALNKYIYKYIFQESATQGMDTTLTLNLFVGLE